MTRKDLATVISGIAPIIKSLTARLTVLEAKEQAPGSQGPSGEKGDHGADGIGEPGPHGKDGAGIASLVISAEGRLIAHLTDGRSVDAGPVPVKDGAPGRDADPSKLLALEAEIAALRFELAAVKSLPVIDVSAVIAAEVAKIPPGPPGKDADLEMVKQFVVAQVATIPAGLDGKDADHAVIAEFIRTELGAAVAALPVAKNGQDGTSVTAEDLLPVVSAIVAKSVAEIPIPKDGAPGIPGARGADGASISLDDVAPMIAAHVQQAVAVLPLAKDGAPGMKGADGMSVSLDDVAPLIQAEVRQTIASVPPAKDGAPGASVQLTDVQPFILEEIAKAVAALPVPRDGMPGTRGERGPDGKSLGPEDVAPLITVEVTKAVAAIRLPKDGAPGEPGARGIDGRSLAPDDLVPLIAAEVQKVVRTIPIPKDGVGVLGALIDREGHLVITLSDGTVKELGAVVGRDVDMADVTRLITAEVAKIPEPKDGKDGRDGLGFEDLDLVSDERGLFLRFFRGDVTKEFRLPVVLDRGVFSDGKTYGKGDGVTWAGSFWIAQDATSAKPGTGATPWRLAVKRGGDGKPGTPGLNGKDGGSGPPGKDGTRYS